MTPREFLRRFHPARSSRPAGLGASADTLTVEAGDVVGVVLMNHGGPGCRADVEPFLYNRLMDPAEGTWGIPGLVRHVASRVLARRRARPLADAYEQIGGVSPLARHTAEQARALERVLGQRFGAATGARFRTYVAMRHWHPSSEEAAAQMAADGVTKVVLLPLHPHASATTAGSSVAYWDALSAAGELPEWPTTVVPEYAAHPTYIQALAERVDEGLQRFPLASRSGVQVVFCAQGAHAGRSREQDPYCCLVHATVQQVVDARAARDPRRSAHVAFLKPLVPGRALGPTLNQTLDALADDGHAHVLVVPVSFVSDRVETAYDLDVVVRARAAKQGVTHFEVTTGLNSHPLFIETLAACVGAQIQPALGGDGGTALPGGAPLAAIRPPRRHHDGALRTVRCAACTHAAEPCDWQVTGPDVPETATRHAA
ncbi:MAG TPA: ferrochelatase [Rubricoccaceae bacterium]|jgi:ferrochelatase